MEPLRQDPEVKRLNIAAMIAYETSREAFGDSVQQNPDAVVLCEQPLTPERPNNVVSLPLSGEQSLQAPSAAEAAS